MLLLAGCVPTTTDSPELPAPEVVKSSVRFQKEYLLAVGDQIEVSVWRRPEFSRTVVIGPDGSIALPLVPRIDAARRTGREVADAIRVELSARLKDPEVTVIPIQVRQPVVYVLGDVKAPGAFPLRNAASAGQALALAGGALRTGGEDHATIIRLLEDGRLVAIPVLATARGQPSGLMTLAATRVEADDILFIPESDRAQAVRMMQDLLQPLQIYLNYKLIEQFT